MSLPQTSSATPVAPILLTGDHETTSALPNPIIPTVRPDGNKLPDTASTSRSGAILTIPAASTSATTVTAATNKPDKDEKAPQPGTTTTTTTTTSNSTAGPTGPAKLDLSGVPEGKIGLISKDKKKFEVERKFTYISSLIRTSIENDEDAKEIDVLVRSDVLEVIVNYMNHHQGKNEPDSMMMLIHCEPAC